MEVHDAAETSSSDEEKPHVDRPYNSQSEADLLHALKDAVQNPKPGIFGYGDLRWLPHTSTGKGSFVDSEIATIPYDRLKDFVEGEQQNPNFPCKFIRRVQRKNAPGSLAFSRACSPSQIIQ